MSQQSSPAPPAEREQLKTTQRIRLKKSEQAPLPAPSKPTQEDESDAFADLNEAVPEQTDPVTPAVTPVKKTFGSGSVEFRAQEETATADEALEEMWSDETGEKPKANFPIFWIAMCSLLLCGVLAFVIFRQRSEPVPVRLEDEVTQEQTLFREGIFDKEERAEVEAIYAQLLERLASFMRAETIEEKAEFVRQPERVLPLMEDYYKDNEFEPEEDLDLLVFNPVTLQQRAFWVTSLESSRDERGLIPVLIEQTEDNELLIDWETFVGHSEYDWEELVETRPEGIFRCRVRIAPASYYVYEFKDRDEWLSLRMVGNRGEPEVNAFLKRDNPGVPLLKQQIRRNKQNIAIIADISFPKNSRAKDAVVIEKVVSPQWVYVNPPEEKSSELIEQE